jgi:Xaa-Pro aminopeptidase
MGDSLRPDWSGRLRRLWRSDRGSSAPAFIISSPVNIKYLTGFEGTAGLISTPSATWLLLDGRYEQAARQARSAGAIADVGIRLVPGRFDKTVAELVAEIGLTECAFEAESVTVATLEAWRRAMPGIVFAATYQWVEELRAIKESFELDRIRAACRATSEVGRALGQWVAAGRTELEISHDIDAALLRAGCTRTAFPTIVASGPASAHPHARPTDRQLRDGDLVVLDFGGVLDGYCGDLTRMAGVGPIPAEARTMFDAVRAAHGAALAAVRAQALAADVDTAARRVLAERGFGDAFLHATGHGLGLEVHEAPRLGRAGEDRSQTANRLQAGMVCTIEPGAYLERIGGVRLEDDVLVTAEGNEVLTDVPRDLLPA